MELSNLDPLHRESSGPGSDFQTLGQPHWLIRSKMFFSVLLDVIFMPRCDYNKKLRMVTPFQERDLINSLPNFWVRDAHISFQMGGGRQCRNVLAQLLWGVYFESKAPTRHHEFALPRCCDCGAGNVRSAAECTRVHQPQWESLLRAFHPIPAFCDSILTFMKIKMRAAWNIFSLRLFQQVSEYIREWIIGKKTLSW